ncbi:PhzF family phenazine biosynthesis isomerase [Kineosporia sp. J2-2]|uniref:PhzF family phenazine biosynthesis isomerase n=1 Tax=Kineosporia corallincola TaxID=2835133 RepID=A0ABS5TKK7_9ACTN|nr:PhzF family phenazine biosynthesis isomerase [Kineosporia corallincola]MBT0771631.1 PhzF family phenazine biosynthesis isomerase [Kineosporia corallincola]
MSSPVIRRYAAFPDTSGAGERGQVGNPAGVVLAAGALDEAQMLAVAAGIGYSETAFVLHQESGRATLRYFSPLAEVPFCGHATIATAVALAQEQGPGDIVFDTPVGPIALRTRMDGEQITASFTSTTPQVRALADEVLGRLLGLLGLTAADLDPALPPRESFAGNWHPVVVLADAARFDAFTFAPGAVRALMDERNWTGTVTVLHRRGPDEFEARNLFPVGAITEDPATGSAAASTGAYLRDLGLLTPPARIVIHQGRHVGRPSLLLVDVPTDGGIVVSGTAVQIADGA